MHKGLRFAACALAVLLVSGAAQAAQDISKSPQVAAYKALVKAVDAGDFEGYKKAMTKAAGEGIDKQIKESGMDPKKGMEMLKEMVVKNIKYTALKVDGKKAVRFGDGPDDGRRPVRDDRSRGRERRLEGRPAELDQQEAVGAGGLRGRGEEVYAFPGRTPAFTRPIRPLFGSPARGKGGCPRRWLARL